MSSGSDEGLPDAGEYCRQVEAYLCRKNEGHLIRIAGPSFTRVCGWAQQGIPLQSVYRGIDRYAERYYAKGARRRPILIDFCEADVLDVFDEWRRAVGAAAGASSVPGGSRRHQSLPAHLERVVVRLTSMRAGERLSPAADAAVDAAARELDAARAVASRSKGDARAALLDRLREIDAGLVDAMRTSVGEAQWAQIEAEAREELSSFRSGMAADAFAAAVRKNAVRILRYRTGLPEIAYED